MHARLQGYAAAWHRSEDFLHRFRSRAQLLLAHHFARFIQHALPTGSIAQVQTNGQFRLDILVARSLRGATLLHCRSPLSVCASSASITWERTASRRETGLLIPSVHTNNHPKQLPIEMTRTVTRVTADCLPSSVVLSFATKSGAPQGRTLPCPQFGNDR